MTPTRPPALRWAGTAVSLVVLLAGGRLAYDNLLYAFHMGRSDLYRTDFALYYTFALTGLRSGWSHLYDLEAQRQAYEVVGHGLWYFPWVYTPPMAWLAAPFTAVALPTAYWLWFGLMALAFLAAWWIAPPHAALAKLAALAGSLSPQLTSFALGLGQFLPLQLLGITASAHFLRRHRDVVAGLCLVPLALHPQGAALVPVALAAAGYWRAVGSLAVAAAVLGAVIVAVLGLHGVGAYLERIRFADANPLTFYVAFGIDLPLLVPRRTRLFTQATVLALTVIAVIRQRGRGPEAALAAGTIGSLLVTSFIHTDDLILLAAAAWLTLGAGFRWWVTAAMLVSAVAALGITYEGTPIYGRYLVIAELAWLTAIAVHPRPAAAERAGVATRPGPVVPEPA